MRKSFITAILLAMLVFPVMGQDDNGNGFQQVWHSSLDVFTRGNLINAGMDVDSDGWGEFLLWNADTDAYQLYEAFGNDQYHIVYQDQGLMNFFDLDEDGQLELVKIHEDEATLEQWITIHEWDNVNLDADLNGGFTEATKTTTFISSTM